MKKINRSVFEIVITVILAAAIFLLAHNAGAAQRGNNLIGGEIFLPFLVLFGREIWAGIKAPFQIIKERK